MRTDHLIEILSQDQTVPFNIKGRVLATTSVALLLTGMVLQLILGWRPFLIPAMQNPVTAMKWLLPLAVAIPAMFACLALVDPQKRRVPIAWISVLVGSAALLWFAFAVAYAPSQLLWIQIRGTTIGRCMVSVIFLSALPLVAAFWWLREGASTAPMRSGALIGLAVGGMSAAVYALFCDEDAPLFFLTWYSLAIGIVTIAASFIGRYLLRW